MCHRLLPSSSLSSISILLIGSLLAALLGVTLFHHPPPEVATLASQPGLVLDYLSGLGRSMAAQYGGSAAVAGEDDSLSFRAGWLDPQQDRHREFVLTFFPRDNAVEMVRDNVAYGKLLNEKAGGSSSRA